MQIPSKNGKTYEYNERVYKTGRMDNICDLYYFICPNWTYGIFEDILNH